MKKPVVLLTTGTRGDVQPYIALGLGLQAEGIPVVLASDPGFAPLAAAYHLPFLHVAGNPSTLLMQPGAQSALTYDGSWLRSMRATLAYLRAARPLYARMLDEAARACRDVAALVVGLPTLWGAHLAEALNIPCVYAFLQPFSRTAAFASALMPLDLPHWAPLNRASHTWVEQAVWQPWRGVIQAWRNDCLGLPPAPFWGIADRLYAQNASVLYAYSASVVPSPPDWPAHHRPTGFWFLDPPAGWAPPPDLAQFLAGGPPPVYLGFGSVGVRDQATAANLILEALRQSDLRAVVNLPPAAFTAPLPAGQVHLLSDTPHTWLFPRCAALVHHGGAGTTAAGLRAGVPALVTPLATDQFFWGSRVAALGAGPKPLPQRALTAGRLAQGLLQLTQDSALQRGANELGTKIRAEMGVPAAVAALRDLL